jgi:hypothetical protein
MRHFDRANVLRYLGLIVVIFPSIRYLCSAELLEGTAADTTITARKLLNNAASTAEGFFSGMTFYDDCTL